MLAKNNSKKKKVTNKKKKVSVKSQNIAKVTPKTNKRVVKKGNDKKVIANDKSNITKRKTSITKKDTKKQKKQLTKKEKILKRFQELIKNIKNEFNKLKIKYKKYTSNKKKIWLNKRIVKKEEKARKKEELINQNISDIKTTPKIINKKIIVSLLVIILITVILVVLFNKDKNKDLELDEINLTEYLNLYDNKELSYVYIKSNDCMYCNLIEPYIDKLQKDYKIVVKQLDINKLVEDEVKQLENSNSVFEEDWKAPILISIKDGKEISNIKGYKEYSVFKKFVEYSNNPEENNSFIKLTIDKYLSVIKSDELSIVYIGRKKSSGCEIYVPVLESVTKEKNIKVYYLDTDILDTERDWEKLRESNDIFEGSWFLPATLIIKDGEIKDYRFESMDSDTLEYFLERNGV